MLWILLVLFQVKHFLCDYPLQRQWMLAKGDPHWRCWVPPLAAHSGVHALGTAAVALVAAPLELALALAAADFAAHFLVDRIKAAPKWGGRWAPSKPQFWWALGADQMAHHLINVAFVYALVG